VLQHPKLRCLAADSLDLIEVNIAVRKQTHLEISVRLENLIVQVFQNDTDRAWAVPLARELIMHEPHLGNVLDAERVVSSETVVVYKL
jgi:hypothetical protein